MMKSKNIALLAIAPLVLAVVFWLQSAENTTDVTEKSASAKPVKPPVVATNQEEKIASTDNSIVNDIDDTYVTGTANITDTGEPAQSKQQDEAIAIKLVSLENELRELQSRFDELLQRAQTDTTAATNPQLQQQIADMAEQRERLAYNYIESTFASEPVDPAWEAEANARLSEGLARIESLASSTVECATTMCRINATTRDNTEHSDAMAIMHSLDDEISWKGQMHVTVNHESGEMTAYLSRPGNSLPQVAN
jgi:hypothetical protein